MFRNSVNPPAECPVCGAVVPPKARACPQCGADERTGWNATATQYDGLDLPDSAFEESDANSRDKRGHLGPTGIPYFTWIVACGLLLIVVTLVIYRLR